MWWNRYAFVDKQNYFCFLIIIIIFTFLYTFFFVLALIKYIFG